MSYITAEDFAARYPLATATDEEVEALAIHASELIDATIVAPYDTDNEDILTVISNATCDQVAAWLEVGAFHDLAGYHRETSMSLGDLTINGQPARVSPRALRTLRQAGLLTIAGA